MEDAHMRRFLPLLLATMLAAFVLPGAVAAAPPATNPVTVPITGTPDAGGTVAGTFEITRFARQNGGIVALGTFTGTVTDAAGNVTGGTQNLALPVAVTGTCDILHLTLGPLDLDLLGLQVHLNQVVLNVDAQSGPGNLLGNLLCAVAGLLDPGPGPLGAITALLNQILAILQQL
jgi:hypothetical protein